MLAAYVSGHGFGHATRTAEVLRAVRLRAPRLPVVVASSAPPELFEAVVGGPLRVRRVACDVGLVQRDALVIDENGSAEAWAAYARGYPALVAEEAAWLRREGARAVLGDVPPLAFAAAAEAGVPSVALANFSWDWVYRHYAARQPALAGAADACAAAYARCGLLLRLPFAGDLQAFPVIEDVPLVARRPRVGRAEARVRLGLARGATVVLLSFGGLGLAGFEPAVLAPLRDLLFVSVAETGDAPPPAGTPGNLRFLTRGGLASAGLGYEDLVGAADVVVSKPGYGIVSDAIAAGTALVYTERGDFPEYPILVEALGRWLPSAYVGNQELRAGRLAEPVAAALQAPRPRPPRLDGAEVAARRLLERAG